MRHVRVITSTLVLTGLALAAGCSSANHLRVATPIIYQAGGVDPFATLPADQRSPIAEVFYATDRRPVDGKDPEVQAYGDQQGITLRLGRSGVRLGGDVGWDELAAVSVSPGQRPADFARVVTAHEDGVLPVSVDHTDAEILAGLNADSFAAAINERLRVSENKDIFVFVPGYKVDFEFPLRKGAELWHYAGRRGVFLSFAWATRLGRLDYLADLEMSSVSTRNLRLLIEFLADETEARKIHIISHSAGTRVAIGALNELRLRFSDLSPEALRARLRIGQNIIIGSEYPFPVFAMDLGDGLGEIAEQTTIYCSQKDAALGLSGWLLEWQRLGDLSLDDLSATEVAFLRRARRMAIIDVTDAEGATAGNGHWYYVSSPWVTSDLVLLLRTGATPDQRGLEFHPDGPIWIFPEDYPDRVRAVIAGGRPAE